MIDVQSEEVVSIREATGHVPKRNGKKVAVSTVWRWAMRGVRGIRLETIVIGGTRRTSLEALQRFFENVTAAADGTAPRARTSRQREAQMRAAERELESAGI